MKACRDCGELKPLSEFHRTPDMADGHRNNCKVCMHAQHRQYLARKDAVREPATVFLSMPVPK